MKIVQLQAENYKRLRAIDITPDESGAVVISGRNAQGKSSVLEAIWAALGGREGNKAAKPIRDGEAQAKVVVDLGDMVVTRLWRNGTTAVKVQSKDGAEYKSPQTLLDSFIGKLTFDPLAFTRLSQRDQKEALLGMVALDVDLDELDAERQEAYERRTEIGRERVALGDAAPVDPSLPEEEMSGAEVLQELSDAMQHNRSVLEAREAAVAAEKRMADLEAALADARAARASADALASSGLKDETALRESLAELDARNALIRENNAAREKAAHISWRENDYAEMTEKINAIDKQKADALARASFPVDGLGFDADGVTFNGVPFSQASAAEQIRVSLAMAMASNPKLRVIRIMDGSLLDDDGMKLIEAAAREHDFQVWVERVANGDGVGFVIEDGEVKEVNADA